MAQTVTEEELGRYSITCGAVLDGSYLMLALTDDERTERDPEDMHAVLAVRRDGVWKLLPTDIGFRSQVAVEVPERCILTVANVGIVRRSSPNGGKQEANVGDASGNRVLGRTRLSEVRAIGGMAYTVGTRRAVYRRTAADVWECIDQGCYTEGKPLLSFQSVHGFSHAEVYAVGAKGDLWMYDGRRWRQLDSGTNVNLRKVLCAPDGMVYIGGDGGVLIRGRHDRWEMIEGISRKYRIWGLGHFAGRLFMTANVSLVLELTEEGVKLVDFGECPIPATAYQFSETSDALYLFGPKDIRRFDGQVWHEELTL